MTLQSGLVRPEDIPVFILCGGLGTRLRRVEALPKAVIPIRETPFLFYILRLLGLQGFRDVHLLLGHGADEVRRALGEGPRARELTAEERAILKPLRIHQHREEMPLGTGGALRMASSSMGALNLILNGDSYAEAIYPDLIEVHARFGASAPDAVTLLAVWEDDRSDYGGLELLREPTPDRAGTTNEDDMEISPRARVVRFLEKGLVGDGWINGGAYLLAPDVLRRLPEGPSSLERDLLPLLAEEEKLAAFLCRCFFRDLGTPERLKRVRRDFRWIRSRF